MYRIEKTIVISASHNLDLTYNSPCTNIHGHNYTIKVGLCGALLNEDGMLYDFAHLKKIVNQYDHRHLNDIMNYNPTAENMCRQLFNVISAQLEVGIKVEYVKIWETPDSWAEYRED